MTDEPLRTALAAAGWTVAELDLHGVRDKAALMDRCAEALALPDWFGRNWDALADSLTDSPALSGGSGGRLLVITGWQGYALSAPAEWGIAQEVFTEAARRHDGLRVLLSLG
ncbi:barstar family protein [Streptomyces sp. NA04227]|uniref:barstar family protein n=1 Tax=Streptomyces sp. NA04227 TaxID=2742136 RepID=UPI00159094A5|nr:barstar family protein [Streptomyces sp. NA04227]QKW05463.1 barstar family protein [Streptomyces sp. NA04227]